MPDLIVDRPELRVTRVPPVARLVLHCDVGDALALAEVSCVPLPAAMLRSGDADEWRVLHLAPDEWLLTGPAEEAAEMTARFAEAALPYSLVDVSDRSLALDLTGAKVADLLNAGCPLDLGEAAFPHRACMRTLFGKVSVLLWRLADPSVFRLEYTRSFDAYVVELVRTAARDVTIG